MERLPIPFEEFNSKVVHLFDRQWLLLTSGDFQEKQYNAMTISWGSLGYIWGRPFVQVVVRPHRYTFEFIEHYPTFTVCAFPPEFRQMLSLLGTRSGREEDKISSAGLTPTAATCVAAPAFAQAELVFECRKIYWQDLDPAHFLAGDIDKNYPTQDYHRMYYGEIVAIEGVEKFR
jgi:flavin reductase (DIM6/NTAB) family NADH-FMN oxidoreductase RutF